MPRLSLTLEELELLLPHIEHLQVNTSIDPEGKFLNSHLQDLYDKLSAAAAYPIEEEE